MERSAGGGLNGSIDPRRISVGTVPPIAAPAVGVAGTDHAEQAAPSGPDENSST